MEKATDQDKYDNAMQLFHRHNYRANGEHTSIKPIPPYDRLVDEAKEWIDLYGSVKEARKHFKITIDTDVLELKLGFIKESRTNIEKCKQMLWLLEKSKYEELYKPI